MRLWVARLVALVALGASGASAAATMPPIHHVFVIVEENESASTTFGSSSPAPYLAKTLRAEGAYLPNYYAIGHESNDNYIAMISGQAPNPQNQADCQDFDDFEPGTIGSYGQAIGSGCVFPSSVKTIADQLDAAGLTWRDYNQSMGADPSREAAECGHPGISQRDGTQSATAADQYATRHDPFVYFHSIIDDTTLCDTHVVNLDLLPQDLSSAASTPNYVFITPDLCGDGHDATCADKSRPGGFGGIDQFLEQWVPIITGSPAYREGNGLLMVIFDEAATSDTSACCGEIPGPNSPEPGVNGPGGGDTGAVMLSPCIKPGTVSKVPYNHYTMLRSVEDIFGLPHLGYAQLPGETSFGADVFTRACGGVPAVSIHAPPLVSGVSTSARARIRWSASGSVRGYTVQVRRTSRPRSRWRTLRRSTTRRSLVFHGRPGATYEFRVQGTSSTGATSLWATTTMVVPSGIHPRGAHYRGHWRAEPIRGAWGGRAMVGSRNAILTLSFTGGTLNIIAEVALYAGVARITLDGHTTSIRISGVGRARRHHIYTARLASGKHRLKITVLHGRVALEGFAIADRLR